ALVFALEAKDAYTRGHSMRVAHYSVEIARALDLDKDTIDTIALGSELHDVGKIGVSESVLHKAAKLTDAEYRHIMEHTVIGARILGPLMRDAPGALAIVRSHHERLDGTGFPDGLKGDGIPFEARVVSVADAFDAMTSVRPYRPSLSVKHAKSELEEGKGVQFDGDIVNAFLKAFAETTTLPIPTPQLQPLRLPTRAMEARRA
ncbi:MAG: HD-GYP domain-containing protein, partial [Gammaproteobacteria bacterium]